MLLESLCASGAHAAFARSALRSIFITSLPPAREQPRAEIPKPATDVDAFLKMNVADKTLTFRLQKGFQIKDLPLFVHFSCIAQRTESKVLKDSAVVFTSLTYSSSHLIFVH